VLDKMRSLMRVLIAAVLLWWACETFALPTPSPSYIAGLQAGAQVDLSPTNASGRLVSVVTNSAGIAVVTRVLPPDINWAFRMGSSWYGINYFGTNAPVGARGTWVLGFGRSLQLHMHPLAIVAALGVLVMLPIVLAWRVTTKGTSNRV
jgi:hypothetical protein